MRFWVEVENPHVVGRQKESIEGDVAGGAETICRRIMRGHVDDGVAIGLMFAMSTNKVTLSRRYVRMGHLQ